MRNISIFVLLILLFGCESEKNKRIFFIKISPAALYNKENEPEVFICRYVEYNIQNENELKIAKSENRYQKYDYKSIPKNGLDHYYTYKLNTEEINSMRKLFSVDYKDSYFRKSGGGIDDRGMDFIIIEKGNNIKVVLYEQNLLPDELRKMNNQISVISNSSELNPSQKNVSERIIKNLQDTLLKRNPPPPRLKSVIKFTEPADNEK